MDKWLQERNEAIRTGKFQMATRDDYQRRAKSFVSEASFGGRRWITGRTMSSDTRDYIDFEFEGDEGFEKLFAQFEALTVETKKAIREYFEKK